MLDQTSGEPIAGSPNLGTGRLKQGAVPDFRTALADLVAVPAW
jgi:hypothetical protein